MIPIFNLLFTFKQMKIINLLRTFIIQKNTTYGKKMYNIHNIMTIPVFI